MTHHFGVKISLTQATNFEGSSPSESETQATNYAYLYKKHA